MKAIKFFYFFVCLTILFSFNIVNAQINSSDIAQKSGECLKQGIGFSSKFLMDLQKVVINLYNTKIAPKAGFWARDLWMRFKAGIMSTSWEKTMGKAMELVKKIQESEIYKNILEFLKEKKILTLLKYRAGYWHNALFRVL